MAILSTVSRVIGAVSVDGQIKLAGNGEYIVRVRKTGERNWDAACDYFTDCKRDAMNTRDMMMTKYRETLEG